MPEDTVKMYGHQQLMARLMELRTARLAEATEEQLTDVATAIRDDAKSLAPVDTGSLKQSIRLQVYHKSGTFVKKVGVSAGGYVTNPKTKRKVDYASYQEFGTSKMPPHPYMRPAIEKHKNELPKMFRGRKI